MTTEQRVFWYAIAFLVFLFLTGVILLVISG